MNSSKLTIPSPLRSNSSIRFSHSSSFMSLSFDKTCFSSRGVIYPFWSKSNKLKASLKFFSVIILLKLEAAAQNSEYSINPLLLRSIFLMISFKLVSKNILSPKYSIKPSFNSSYVRTPSLFLSSYLNVYNSLSSFALEFILFVIYAITATSSLRRQWNFFN